MIILLSVLCLILSTFLALVLNNLHEDNRTITLCARLLGLVGFALMVGTLTVYVFLIQLVDYLQGEE